MLTSVGSDDIIDKHSRDGQSFFFSYSMEIYLYIKRNEKNEKRC